MKNALQVISCENAPNMVVSGAKLNRSSSEDVEIGPKAQMSIGLRDGQIC